MKSFLAHCIHIALLIAFVASCSPGTRPVAPLPSLFIALQAGNKVGISGPPGSADPGTEVSITVGGTGQGTAGADGSVSFLGTSSAELLTLAYLKAGQQITSEAAVQSLASRVTSPLFATGSGPNDMELLDGRLVIANALDNTVTAHNPLTGAVEHTAVLPQFASPSYLAAVTAQASLIARNGDNTVTALGPALVPSEDYAISSGASFAGLGKLATNGRYVFVPHANITSFEPTVYGPGLLTIIDLEHEFEPRTVELAGHNGVYALVDPAVQRLYVVSAGELHFDENFVPSVTTEGALQAFSIGSDGALTEVWRQSLAATGAGVMAIRPATPTEGARAYLGSLVSGDIYEVDLSGPVFNPNPFHLSDEYTYVSDIEYVVDSDLLLATSFNTDELYVIEPLDRAVSPAPYPAPFQVSPDPELLAGAIAVEADAEGNAYVLLGIANAVAKVRLLP